MHMKNFTTLLKALAFLTVFPLLATGQDAVLRDDGSWTIVNQWEIHDNAGGLASDGDVIYIGSLYGGVGEQVYSFDPQTEELEFLFSGPQDNTFGLTYDGEYLWTITREINPAHAVQMDMDGNQVSTIELSENFMSGIAWDDGTFWVGIYHPNPGTIQNIDLDGDEISSFVPPSDQPWDLAMQGDSIWIADNWNGDIHLVESDGTLVQSFPYDDHRVSGIYYDGVFLWYVGRTSTSESTLYQVDPWGTGTPVIQVPESYHYGNVTLGDEAQWDMTVQNNGTGELVIDDITFPEGNASFSVDENFPVSIEAEGSAEITIVFDPQEIHMFEKVMSIHSNDVATPVAEVLISGNGLADGPYLYAYQDLIDFGSVRMNSSTRDYMVLRNMGDEALVIEQIDFPIDAYWWNWTVEFPITLDPVDIDSLAFWFQPASEGVFDADASIVFNHDEQSPYALPLTGESTDMEFPLASVIWDTDLPGHPSLDNPRALLSVPDVNDDGVDDVLICTRGLTLHMLAGNASDTPDMLWEAEIGTVEYPKAVRLTDDLNDDGYLDIVIGTAYGDRAVTALSSRTGEVIWRFETTAYGGGGWVYMIDVSYDYNGNGYKDVLAATGDDGDGTGPRRVFLIDGSDGEMIWDTQMGGAAYSVLAVDDFTGDGVPDVVAGGQTPAEEGKVLGISGATGDIEWEISTAGTSVWALEQISDITENGIRDVIVGSFSGHYYLLDVTDGEVVHSGNLGNALILDFWLAGDLNDDGYMDVFPSYSTVNQARAISGKDGQFIWSTEIADQGWAIAPMRDISGDGVNDVAVGTLHQHNYLYFLGGADGAVLDSVPMPGPVDAITAVPDITGDNSMEVIATSRNNYAVALSGGTKVAMDYYFADFIVTDEQEPAHPIEEATIVIAQTGHSSSTDEDGTASFELVEGEYDFTVTKEGYFTQEGTFFLDEDKTVEVQMIEDDTSIEEMPDGRLVKAYNYPNPFSDYTNIAFTLTSPAKAAVYVYDMNGRRFNIVPENQFQAGENVVQWNATGPDGARLNDGIYIFEIKTDEATYRDRMFLLRQ